MYNLLIGGAAGQGIDTTAAILEKLLKRSGYSVFTVRDLMSRIRGGHNYSLIRFGADPVMSHSHHVDGIIALDRDTVELHRDQLNPGGFILCDSALEIDDPRAIRIDMARIAKELGNPRVAGSIATGAVLKLFGGDLAHAEEVFKTFLKDQYIAINLKAVQAGYDLTEARFSSEAGDHADDMIISGSKAVALGAIAAGLRFYAAYPMSPSTPILEYLASKADETGIVVEQAEDEIAAINMAIGGSYAGARSMTGTSGGGFSLMVEAFGLAGITETPLIVVDVQRPGPATGLPTRTEQGDLSFVLTASQGEFPRLVIALRHHTDAFYQTARALYLAEKYQIPVMVLSDQYLGDATATVEPYDLTRIQTAGLAKPEDIDGEYLRYKLTESGISPRLAPGKSKHLVAVDSDEHDERGFITESAGVRTQMVDKRMRKLNGLKEELIEPDFIGPDSFETLLIGFGSTYGAIAEATGLLNEKEPDQYAALVFGDVYPLPQKTLLEKAGKAKRIVNIEQNATGQLARLIRQETGIACTGSILKYDGRQITAEEIVERMGDLK